MYLALERKPNNGGKIQNLANVASGIMLHLKVVKSAKEEKAISTDAAAANEDKDDCNDNAANKGGKGTRVLLESTEPWHHSGRIVTTDAYFTSVKAATKMKEKGLFLLGTSSSAAEGFRWRFWGMPPLQSKDCNWSWR
jgi:hypothetical protein